MLASRGLLGNTIRKKREGRFDVGCGVIFGWWALVGVLLVAGADEVAHLPKVECVKVKWLTCWMARSRQRSGSPAPNTREAPACAQGRFVGVAS